MTNLTHSQAALQAYEHAAAQVFSQDNESTQAAQAMSEGGSEGLNQRFGAAQGPRSGADTSLWQDLGPRLLQEFHQAEMDRAETETRWLQDLRQYRGVYDPEVLAAIGPMRSKAFVRKTRVKVKTLDSRMADLLFPAGSEKNWSIEPTPKPQVSAQQREMMVQALQQQAVQAATVTATPAMPSSAPNAQGAAPGMPPTAPVPAPSEAEIEAAILNFSKNAAQRMSLVIEDQLSEARYKDICLKALHSGHLFGTGILKGPLVERRVRTRFVLERGQWRARSESCITPFLDFVPVWRFYPDMSGVTLNECRFVYERHLMTHADLVALMERPSFDGEKIKSYVRTHRRGALMRVRSLDEQLRSIGQRETGLRDGQYEVLERWGWLSGEELRDVGLDVPEHREHESFFSNIWLLPNGEIIKAVLQPIDGVTWPYHLYSFDKDETSIFGEGLASIMRDDQTMLNAATRIMLDNAALTSGPMLEVSRSLLSAYENVTDIHAWKVFERNNQQPGMPAVRVVELPNRLGDLSAMAQMFEANADEVTAIPRYMTGENQAMGAAGTASGLSMLMGAANIVVKDLINAWDEGVTRTFLQGLYRWNMQFNPDVSIKGDFDVKARGTASMVAREVRAYQLNEFAAQTANPLDAPYVRRQELLRQRAQAHELSGVIKSDEEVAAEMTQQMSNPAQQMQQELAMQQQQLAMAELSQRVQLAAAHAAKAQADAARAQADVGLIQARTLGAKMDAGYVALQASAVAQANPQAGDLAHSLLASQDSSVPKPHSATVSLPEVSGHTGQRAGIHTPEIEVPAPLKNPPSGEVQLAPSGAQGLPL